jgi:alpha-glucosidase
VQKVGNHDQGRVANRFRPELIDAISMMIQLLPGVSVTYYGEEIGMTNTFITWEQTQDPWGCNFGPESYMNVSRDPERTPMQWDRETNAGTAPYYVAR